MNTEDILDNIGEEILSRNFLTKEDIKRIVSSRVDLLIDSKTKDSISSLELEREKLKRDKAKATSKKEFSTIKKKQELLNVKIKRFNMLNGDNDTKRKIRSLKNYVVSKEGMDFYINICENGFN